MINCEQARKVAVVGYNRIPFARINTAYINASNQDMLVATLNGLIEKYHLKNEILGEVAGGAVVKSSRESNLIRESVMNTSLDQRTPACDIQQACSMGTEASIYIATHAIGYNVTEIIMETVVARKLKAACHEVLNSIHPYPTMSEAIKDATEAAFGEAIHL